MVLADVVAAFLALATTFLVLGLAPTFLVADVFFEGDFGVEAAFFGVEATFLVGFFSDFLVSFFSEGFLLAAGFFVFGVVAAAAVFGLVLVVFVLGLADTFFLGCSFSEADNLNEAFTFVSFSDSTPLFKAFRRRC